VSSARHSFIRKKLVRRSLPVIAATVAFAGAYAAGARPASAAPGCNPNHCYSVVNGGANPWSNATSPVYLSQAGVDLEADCLAVLNPTSSGLTRVSWETWVATNITGDVFPQIPSWVEAGIADGSVAGSAPGFGWFWAEQTPSGSYQEHWAGQAAEDQRKNITFRYLGGGSWDVFLAGAVVGNPTDNTGNAGGVQLGAEVAGDNQAQVNAHAWNWQYLNAAGTAWSTVTPSKTGYYPSNPVNFAMTWGADPTTRLLDVTVHTTGNSQQCGDPVLKAQASTHWHPSLASVRQVAAAALARKATGRATSAAVVHTTRHAATALTGSAVKGPGSTASVYLVQELGSFTERVATPSGKYIIDHGSAITVVIDAATGHVLDWGIEAHPHKLQSLGKVSALTT
jgi:hypothetical protein